MGLESTLCAQVAALQASIAAYGQNPLEGQWREKTSGNKPKSRPQFAAPSKPKRKVVGSLGLIRDVLGVVVRSEQNGILPETVRLQLGRDNVTSKNVTNALRNLWQAGLVTRTRAGKGNRYHATPEGVTVFKGK